MRLLVLSAAVAGLSLTAWALWISSYDLEKEIETGESVKGGPVVDAPSALPADRYQHSPKSVLAFAPKKRTDGTPIMGEASVEESAGTAAQPTTTESGRAERLPGTERKLPEVAGRAKDEDSLDENEERRRIDEEDRRIKAESLKLTPAPLPEGQPRIKDLSRTEDVSGILTEYPPAIPPELPEAVKAEDRKIKKEGKTLTAQPDNLESHQPETSIPAIPPELPPDVQAEDRRIKAESTSGPIEE